MCIRDRCWKTSDLRVHAIAEIFHDFLILCHDRVHQSNIIIFLIKEEFRLNGPIICYYIHLRALSVLLRYLCKRSTLLTDVHVFFTEACWTQYRLVAIFCIGRSPSKQSCTFKCISPAVSSDLEFNAFSHCVYLGHHI